MKKILLLSAILCLISTAIFSQLSDEEWRKDLRFLQETIHSDYHFLFKKTTPEAFDNSVEKIYDQIPNLEEHQIIVELMKLVSSFQYGHTSLGSRHGHTTFHRIPINLYQFKDGVYIEGGDKRYEDAVGAKVLSIEGKPIAEVMDAIYPVVPAENKQFFKAYGINYMNIAEILHAQGITETLKKDISFTLEINGEKKEQVFEAISSYEGRKIHYGHSWNSDTWMSSRDTDKTPLYLKNIDKIYYYEYLPQEKAVYVRQSQVQDDSSADIPTFYAEVFEFIENNDVEKLIIDVRLNGGGNNYKNKAVVTGIIRTEKIDQIGHLFVIIGKRTFSACQNLVNEFDNYTNAIFVGEPTAENINFYGDNNTVILPNSHIPVYLSFAWWQDKPQWENSDWTVPHIPVQMTFEEYKSNKDPVLESALSFDADSVILDPMSYITDLFQSGEIEKLQREVIRLVNDPFYQFVNFESEFNNAGYKLLNGGRLEEAKFVFEMNTQLFPDSANCWDSLAESYWKMGDKENAIKYYNKAIELDPEGPTGDHASNMLLEIKSSSEH